MIIHPDIILIGGEEKSLPINNTYQSERLTIKYDLEKGWIFCIKLRKDTPILFKKCERIEIHDTVKNKGRLFIREYLVIVDGKQMWGKEKIYKDRMDKERYFIQECCNQNQIEYDYHIDWEDKNVA